MNTEGQALQARLEQMEHDNAEIRAQFRNERRRFRAWSGLALATVVGAILISPSNRAALAQGYGTTLRDLIRRVKALEDKTQYMSVIQPIDPNNGCPEQVFSGVNVRIINGLGSTFTTNGCGNLIVGYNGSRVPFGERDNRTGSHNLILGDQNNYSSYGGLVAGAFDAISARYASVSGGAFNTASGDFSSVSGGTNNTASGQWSSVSGGIGTGESNTFGWSGGSLHWP